MSVKNSILVQVEKFDNGAFEDPSRDVQINAGWYDWFCSDKSLKSRTKKLYPKVKKIIKSNEHSQRFDPAKVYVSFKNNFPMVGELYDDFRIIDMETYDVLYTIVPKSGMQIEDGKALLYGRENEFSEPLFRGKWHDLIKFFGEKNND